MAVTFKEAKRTISRFIMDMQGPVNEAENIQRILTAGEITDLDWKRLSDKCKKRLLNALQNCQDNLLADIQAMVDKINPPPVNP